MARRPIDPEIADALNQATANFVGRVFQIGGRAVRAVAESVLDDVADLGEDLARRARRAGRAARNGNGRKLPDDNDSE